MHVCDQTDGDYYVIHTSCIFVVEELIECPVFPHHIPYIFKGGLVWWLCWSVTSCRTWYHKCNVNGHIAFLLQEWQQNSLNNVLNLHGTVKYFFYKHEPYGISISHYDARIYTFLMYANIPWKMLVFRFMSDANDNIMTELALITECHLTLKVSHLWPDWRHAQQFCDIIVSLVRDKLRFPTVYIDTADDKFVLIYAIDAVQTNIVAFTMSQSWWESV